MHPAVHQMLAATRVDELRRAAAVTARRADRREHHPPRRTRRSRYSPFRAPRAVGSR